MMKERLFALERLAIHALTQGGYDAQWLKATLEKKREEERPITQVNTVERQLALANVRTHGSRFHVTVGMHVTSNDFFTSHGLVKIMPYAQRWRRTRNADSNSKQQRKRLLQ